MAVTKTRRHVSVQFTLDIGHGDSRGYLSALLFGSFIPAAGRGYLSRLLVGDIYPTVGRGYLSPTSISAEISPPHHRTSLPGRVEQDKCPEKGFDGDKYPRRTRG